MTSDVTLILVCGSYDDHEQNHICQAGARFIGPTLATILCEANRVMLFDHLSPTVQYPRLAEHRNVQLVMGDVLDYEALLSAMRDADIVVHAAAIAGIDAVIKSPIRTMEVNRAWYYVADMMEGLMRALENPQAIGEWFDIGNMHAVTTIFGLAEAACRVLNSKSEIVFVDPLSADSGLRIPESKQTEVLLGFKAKVELKYGIRRTARCHEQNMS